MSGDDASHFFFIIIDRSLFIGHISCTLGGVKGDSSKWKLCLSMSSHI